MLPSLYVNKKLADAVGRGKPWLMASEIDPSSALLTAAPGALMRVADERGNALATGYYNPKSAIACRILTLNVKEEIDEEFFTRRLQRALEKRDARITIPYYRLVHSEADGLPGLVIDRFDDVFVCQITTAGMERLAPLLFAALEKIFNPRVILCRNDVPSREKEGLTQEVKFVKGALDGPVAVKEENRRYLADLEGGQKTGWFFDQRDNHTYLASLCKGKTMLDVYSYVGGFAIACAVAGAKEVAMVDSSAPALTLARKALALNNTSATCNIIEGKAYEVLARLAEEKRVFDVVSLDPPAFAKSRRDLPAALKGYEKLVRLAAPLVSQNGILAITSCSHHAARHAVQKAAEEGLKKAGRAGHVLRVAGAASDHPAHPMLPESDYLKMVTFAVD